MKFWAGAVALILVLGFSIPTAYAEDVAGPQANLVGTVHDADSGALEGVGLVILSTDGEEVGKTTTGADGTYSFGCVDLGTHHLELTSGSGFHGQKVAAPVGPNGLRVAWAVDAERPALASATATAGACQGGVAAVGTGAGVGAAAGVGTSTVLAAVVAGGALAAGVGVGIASATGNLGPDSPAQ